MGMDSPSLSLMTGIGVLILAMINSYCNITYSNTRCVSVIKELVGWKKRFRTELIARDISILILGFRRASTDDVLVPTEHALRGSRSYRTTILELQ
jgi:hypothetical protein